MGTQEVKVKKKKKKLHQRRHGMRAEDHPDGKNVWVLTHGMLQQQRQLKPVKTGRRRQGQQEEERGGDQEVEEGAVTPKGAGCRIPAEAETCPPAPKKKPRTAVLIRDGRRCNCGGEALEFFRVPVDLEAAFASLAACQGKLN